MFEKPGNLSQIKVRVVESRGSCRHSSISFASPNALPNPLGRAFHFATEAAWISALEMMEPMTIRILGEVQSKTGKCRIANSI